MGLVLVNREHLNRQGHHQCARACVCALYDTGLSHVQRQHIQQKKEMPKQSGAWSKLVTPNTHVRSPSLLAQPLAPPRLCVLGEYLSLVSVPSFWPFLPACESKPCAILPLPQLPLSLPALCRLIPEDQKEGREKRPASGERMDVVTPALTALNSVRCPVRASVCQQSRLMDNPSMVTRLGLPVHAMQSSHRRE